MENKIDQIAIYVNNVSKIKKELNQYFNLDPNKWVTDKVKAYSKNEPFEYSLAFNYELLEGDLELEFLEKTGGTSFHDNLQPPCISHFGIHVENLRKEVRYFNNIGFEIIQPTETKEHSNAVRTYKYSFVETFSLLGFPIKLIERGEKINEKEN